MTSIRKNWRFLASKKNIERTIVGFDLRRGSSIGKLFMTSYDDNVRYEEINEKYQGQQSGLNLFSADPSEIPSLIMPVDARIVAFDLPTEFVQYLSEGNFSSPQPLPKVNMAHGWNFCGFDVVDVITQTSAFHGFDIFPFYKKINSNRFGLIDDFTVAMDAAIFFDSRIPEHAPFLPCGIWLKD